MVNLCLSLCLKRNRWLGLACSATCNNAELPSLRLKNYTSGQQEKGLSSRCHPQKNFQAIKGVLLHLNYWEGTFNGEKVAAPNGRAVETDL